MSAERRSRRDVIRTLSMSGAAAASFPAWAEALAAVAREHAHARPASLAAPGDWAPRVLDSRRDEAIVALTEAIIPETETPGARAALVNRFVDGVLADAAPEDRERFLTGLDRLDARCRERSGKGFADATSGDQMALLEELSAGASRPDATGPDVEFFRAIKAMTIEGYYSSEIGLREELGDDGTLAFAEFAGCEHPEHGAPPKKTT